MKLQHFTESTDYQPLPPEVERLCSNHLAYLKEAHLLPREYLWRGIQGFGKEMVHGDQWKILNGWESGGRKPMSVNPDVQEAVDNVLYDVTGIRIRESSVFITQNERQASSYGYSVVVLLPNKFRMFKTNLHDFYVSTVYNDMLHAFIDLDDPRGKTVRTPERFEKATQIFQKWLKEEGEISELKTFDEIHKGKHAGELMLICDQYTVVDESTLKWEYLT